MEDRKRGELEVVRRRYEEGDENGDTHCWRCWLAGRGSDRRCEAQSQPMARHNETSSLKLNFYHHHRTKYLQSPMYTESSRPKASDMSSLWKCPGSTLVWSLIDRR